MPSSHGRIGGVLSVCGALLVACGGPVQAPSVVFESAAPIGRWAEDAPSTAPASQPSTVPVPGTSTPGTTLPGIGPGAPPMISAGSNPGSAGVASPSAGTGGASASGHAGAAAAAGGTGLAAGGGGTGGSAGAGPSATSATSLAFDVTTSPVGGFYQPRNIGAIWVQDSSGKLVKSLEVWAGIRRRYLTKYTAALGFMAVDVTASATLSSHRAHHSTWDMKDRTGAAAPPGKYTLMMETTDSDATGRSASVDFDTTAGPQTVMPPAAPSFSAMQLQLH
jgi:hypothetical protein